MHLNTENADTQNLRDHGYLDGFRAGYRDGWTMAHEPSEPTRLIHVPVQSDPSPRCWPQPDAWDDTAPTSGETAPQPPGSHLSTAQLIAAATLATLALLGITAALALGRGGF